MAKNLDIKKKLVNSVSSELSEKGEINAFVVNYASLSSVDMNNLKAEMYKSGSSLKVIKNTLIRKILEKAGVGIESQIEGQNALLIPGADTVSPLKDLFAVIKKLERGSVVFGVLNGRLIDSKQVEDLSNLPSREVLIARMLGGFTSPIRGFAVTLNGVQGNFVRVLNAIKEKQQ